jgi:hypothetical protein
MLLVEYRASRSFGHMEPVKAASGRSVADGYRDGGRRSPLSSLESGATAPFSHRGVEEGVPFVQIRIQTSMLPHYQGHEKGHASCLCLRC